jgi:hypothetical protein
MLARVNARSAAREPRSDNKDDIDAKARAAGWTRGEANMRVPDRQPVITGTSRPRTARTRRAGLPRQSPARGAPDRRRAAAPLDGKPRSAKPGTRRDSPLEGFRQLQGRRREIRGALWRGQAHAVFVRAVRMAQYHRAARPEAGRARRDPLPEGGTSAAFP